MTGNLTKDQQKAEEAERNRLAIVKQSRRIESWSAAKIKQTYDESPHTLLNYAIYLHKHIKISLSSSINIPKDFVTEVQATKFITEYPASADSIKETVIQFCLSKEIQPPPKHTLLGTTSASATASPIRFKETGSASSSSNTQLLDFMNGTNQTIAGIAQSLFSLISIVTKLTNQVQQQPGTTDTTEKEQRLLDLKTKQSREIFTLDEQKSSERFKGLLQIRRF